MAVVTFYKSICIEFENNENCEIVTIWNSCFYFLATYGPVFSSNVQGCLWKENVVKSQVYASRCGWVKTGRLRYDYICIERIDIMKGELTSTNYKEDNLFH